MNDSDFFKSFGFREFTYTKRTHVDNSAGVKCHYLGYIKDGSGVLISSRERLQVTTGDLFYIPKGCRYHSCWIPEKTVRFDSISFVYFPLPEGLHYPLQKLPCNREILEAFRPLSLDKTVNAASIGCLYSLLALLQPHMECSPSECRNSLTDTALAYLQADPGISIAALAELCCVSQGTLYGNFHRCLGKTPNTIRQELLCQKAMQLLVTTSLSVEEVSRQCGFSSASYFRKVLLSITGKTPRQIRAEANVL